MSGLAETEGPPPTRAYLQAVSAGALWGSAGPFSVALFRMGLPPESVAVWRLVVGLLGLLLFALAVAPGRLAVDRRGLFLMLVPGGVATAGFHLAYQLSTEAIGVPSTVALLYLAPAIVVAASPVLGEMPTLRKAGLAVVSVVGVWMTVLGAEGAAFRTGLGGVLWGIATGLGFASYTLFARWVTPRYGALPTLLYSSAAALVILATAYPLLGWEVAAPGSLEAWGTVALFGLATVTVAMLLFYHALGTIEASRAAIGATVEPLVAALLALLLLDQGLETLGWAGLALLVVGVTGAYAAPTRSEVRSDGGPGA